VRKRAATERENLHLSKTEGITMTVFHCMRHY